MLKSPFYKMISLEANIIPDSSEETDFYSIRQTFSHNPTAFGKKSVKYITDFMEQITEELMQYDTSKMPYAYIIASYDHFGKFYTELAILKITITPTQILVDNLLENNDVDD